MSAPILGLVRDWAADDGQELPDGTTTFKQGCPVCSGPCRVTPGGRVCCGQPEPCEQGGDLARFFQAPATKTEQGAQPASTAADEVRVLLDACRVDLNALLRDGIPPREWLQASPHMFARAASHHIAAPMKSGKSLSILAHLVHMAAEGARVVILDRENGAEETARRLQAILETVPAGDHATVLQNLSYYAWPNLKLTHGPALAEVLAGVDLVIFDSTRMFLTALDLAEDGNDDFASFVLGVIDPLRLAGIATITLDNTGHDGKRPRGASAKGDLAQVNYSLKKVKKFDSSTTGTVELLLQPSRFGDLADRFTMQIGGGTFGRFTREEDQTEDGTAWPTHVMEKVSRFLEGSAANGTSKNAIESALGGKRETVRAALAFLVRDGYVREEHRNQSILNHSLKPYREPDLAPSPQHRPNLAPGEPFDTSPPRPFPKKGEGEDEPDHNKATTDLAQPTEDAA